MPDNYPSFRIVLIALVISFILIGTVAAQPAPVADFTAKPVTGLAPLTVSFTDSSLNTPTGWAWYFGDENFRQAWTTVNANARWPARNAHSSIVLSDGSIILMGGQNISRFLNDVWRSADNGATWTQVTSHAGWSARFCFSSVTMPDDSIVLMGGFNGGSSVNDVWRSEDKGATWTQVRSNADWSEREAHSSVVTRNGSIVLMGGTSGAGPQNDTWLSTDRGATWTQANPSSGWPKRYGQSSVILPDGSIVLMGGYDNHVFFNDVWRSVDNGTTWTQVNASPGWSGRCYATSVAMPDGSIVLMGGNYVSGYYSDVWRSTDNGATWTQASASPGWSGRTALSSVVTRDSSILVMGGQSSVFLNDVWRLAPAGSSLKNPSHTYTTPGTYTVALQEYNAGSYNSTRKTAFITVLQRPPIAGFTANLTSGMVPLPVSFTDTSTGSPEARAWYFGDENYSAPWTLVNGSAGWSERYGAASVAMPDGSIMIMGGSDGTTYKNDVWRSTNGGVAWTRMNASAGWSARYGHRVVAMPDGSIVLTGGGNDSVVKNDVWRSTDQGATWNRINASAGWSARCYPTTLVMPDGSIVLMGGNGYGSLKNDVWRSTDNGVTWMRVNAGASWSPRFAQSSALMADGSILLMGGKDSSSYKNDVWRSTNGGVAWTRMNASAGWSPRFAHSSTAMPDGSVLLMSGYGGSASNDVWRSTDYGATWMQVNPGASWSPRYAQSSVLMTDGSILLMGGGAYGGDSKNDVWQFAPFGSSAKNPSHTYTKQGDYTVSLRVCNNGGCSILQKSSYIKVKASTPTFVSIVSPTPWYRNATINYTITGTNLNSGSTVITFRNKSGLYLNGTDAGVISVTATTIKGQVHVPNNAPAGSWNVSITTGYGGTIWKDSAFTVMWVPSPVIASIAPASGFKNATIVFTITGTDFPTGSGFTNVSFVHGFTGTPLYGTITSVTSGRITGTLAIPADQNGGSCDLVVSTIDGGSATRENAFTINNLPLPVISSINQTTGFKNSTVAFAITGNYFQPWGSTFVRLSSPAGAPVNAAVTNVTGTKITGTFRIPAGAATGKYRLDVVTLNGGTAALQNAFTINPAPKPQITAVSPTWTYRNRTLIITVTGANFQPSGGTYVNLTHPANNTDISMSLISVTPGRLNGTVMIPPDAPTSLLWKLNVTTLDGGRATMPSAITIKTYPAPAFGSISPVKGNRGAPIAFTLKGTNFQTEGTNVTFWNRTGNTVIVPTLVSVSPTEVTGSVLFAADANQSWYVNITTVDGGQIGKEKAFTAL
jgi:PKD repeat protein